MWSNVISIDKELDREVGFILDKLKELKDLSFALEESKDRIFIYLACTCESQDRVEEEVLNILETVFLSFMKLRFFMDRLTLPLFNHAVCSLICSMVHFDREFERNILRKAINDTIDYNVDGLMNFRLRSLTDNWQELCVVAARLMEGCAEENEFYDIATFITGTEGGRCQLSLSKSSLYNLTSRLRVEVVNLFDENELNLLSAIIKERPSEIVIEGAELSPPMNNTLKHIARLIVK